MLVTVVTSSNLGRAASVRCIDAAYHCCCKGKAKPVVFATVWCFEISLGHQFSFLSFF